MGSREVADFHRRMKLENGLNKERLKPASMSVRAVVDDAEETQLITNPNGKDWLAELTNVVYDPEDPPHEIFESLGQTKINKERIFVTANLLIELLSATLDQLSSVHKPRYALIAMLTSFIASIVCIIEFAYKVGKERVVWRWASKLPWFYYSSPSNKRFGSVPEIIGLICAILQSILSAIAYTFYMKHADYPIKISFWPIVFALGLLCSKFM